MKRSLFSTALVAAVSLQAAAQLSGFISATRGYHANPLYNYERIGDQLTQSYMELGFTEAAPASLFRVSYVSGLMLFNRFTDRNYYEHTFSGAYAFSPDARGLLRPGDDADHSPNNAEPGLDGEEVGEESEHVLDASTYPALELTASIGARHDKNAFREFDNVGAGFGAAYRWKIAPELALRISNAFGYRRYVYLSPLSNITDQLSVELGVPPGGTVRYGISAGTGVKHFTETLIDSTRFETIRTYILKPAGRGKGGGMIKVPSDKQLLLNPGTQTIVQIAAGVFAEIPVDGGSLKGELLYRRNPGRPTRYLAQYANTSILNEDIYNDHFSFDGPSVILTLRHRLPLALQGVLTAEFQRKQFGAPGLNLEGVEIASNRIDRRSSLELYVSRYVELSAGLGLDIAVSGEVLRNQSNDDYNDYSLLQAGFSLGVGF